MSKIAIICACGHKGMLELPYVSFDIMTFVFSHHQNDPKVPGLVTLICSCGAECKAGPLADRSKSPFESGFDFGQWTLQHQHCNEATA